MDDQPLDMTTLSPSRLELVALLLMEEADVQLEMIPSQLDDSCEFPLSFGQQQLWFLDYLQPGNFSYNESVSVRLSGKLNVAVLRQSIDEIIRRHGSLRTTFTLVEGSPRQIIGPPQSVHLISYDISDLSDAEQRAKIQALEIEETQAPFDLRNGPLLRLSLLFLAKDRAVVLLTIHHIISDGWSMGIFVKELAALYTALLQGQPSPLPPLPIQYSDYAVWQRTRLQGEVLEQHLAYWKRQLSAPLPVLQLPLDHPRPAVQRFRGATHFFQMPGEASEGLKRLGRQEGATLFMVLLAAFEVVLHQESGQEDLVVGTDVANRTRVETEQLIGLFVNQLVLRVHLGGSPSFREVLRRVRRVALEAFAHQDLPFDRLVEALNPERDLSRTPLFQVKFVLQNASTQTDTASNAIMKSFEVERGTSKFDLLLNISENEQNLFGWLEYNTDIFEIERIKRLIKHLEIVLKKIVSDIDIQLSALKEVLTVVDREEQFVREQQLQQVSLQKLGEARRKKNTI